MKINIKLKIPQNELLFNEKEYWEIIDDIKKQQTNLMTAKQMTAKQMTAKQMTAKQMTAKQLYGLKLSRTANS